MTDESTEVSTDVESLRQEILSKNVTEITHSICPAFCVKINEVYDKLLIDYKKINQPKTPKDNSDELVKGAFNEASYKGAIQEYEEDNYGNAYDPSQSLLLAL